MKIKDLKEFNFYIGNTDDGEDIAATNDGIEGDDGVLATYSDDADINSVDDLMEVINDAISECDLESEDGLGTYLGADVTIKEWWKENYE